MRKHLIVTLVAALVIVAAGCASNSNSANDAVRTAFAPTTTTTSPPTTTTPPPACAAETAEKSKRPNAPLPSPGQMPAGSYMDRIQQRGKLIVGVDQNTLLFGFRDPITGVIDGFDVALAREIARAIFGDPNAIDLRAVTSAERLNAVEDGQVDLVASQITVTCARRQEVDLSTVYYLAHQQLLVRSEGSINSVADLARRTVCATEGSTSIAKIERVAPKAKIYPVANRTDCLVALQEGKVDAITSDDTILLGFEIQDPENTKILPYQLEQEPYGLATSKDHDDFGRFVNSVLEELRENGRLEELYQQYLNRPDVGFTPPATPPPAQYLDP